MPFRDPEAKRRYMMEYLRRLGIREHQRLSIKARRRRIDVKERERQYRQRPIVKERTKLAMRRYRKHLSVKQHQRQYMREYRQRPSAKLLHIIQQAKHLAKGFVPLCPNEWDCPVDWHHVSPNHPYVVPLPREIHRAVYGANHHHFAFNASMICLLYELDSHGC